MNYRLRYVIKPFRELTEDEVKQLSKLTLQTKGSRMLHVLHPSRRLNVTAYAVMAFLGKERVGWAVVRKLHLIAWSLADLNFFVAKKHRRQGIGTRLFKKATRLAKSRWPYATRRVMAWDPVSRDFFYSVHAKVA